MVLLFKVGDIVWAKTSGYSATFYHRPCEVLSVWGDIITVKVLDSSFTYEVEATNFELAPLRAILETGDKLIHKDTKEKLIFKDYFENGRVFCTKLNGIVQIYNISDIVRSDNFYV